MCFVRTTFNYFLNVSHVILYNYTINLFKVIWCKTISKVLLSLAWKQKINKSNTKVSTHYGIICLYSKNICYNYRFINKYFNFFWNMFNSKTIKTSNIIIQCMQSNPMSSNIRIRIKIYYICPVLYFIWYIICRINIIKPRFILIILLYFQIS